MPNVPEYIIAVLGALTGGLKITPINPSFTPGTIKRSAQSFTITRLYRSNFAEEIAKQLLNSEAKLIVTLNDLYRFVRTATSLINKRNLPLVTVNHTVHYTMLDEVLRGRYHSLFSAIRIDG